VPTTERLYDAGTRRADRWRRELGEEFRHRRLELGLSQREVAAAARIDRSDYSRIEHGVFGSLSITAACRVGSVLALDVSVRVFPGGSSIRDAGQTPRLQKLLACVGPPLSYRLEVGLPNVADRRDPRAWDVVLFGHGERSGVEFEARLYDFQAQLRRLRLKARDDPVDHLLLVVADTDANRRVLAEFADLLPDLPRLRTESVLNTLRAGRHPPTGVMLLDAPRPRAAPPTASPDVA
jgi:transcriptional regulator with XRE-family HTH domain